MWTEGFVIDMRIPIAYDFLPSGKKTKFKRCFCGRPTLEGRVRQQLLEYLYDTVLGQKDSSDAHYTPKVANFATLPLATIFIRIHKNFAVY